MVICGSKRLCLLYHAALSHHRASCKHVNCKPMPMPLHYVIYCTVYMCTVHAGLWDLGHFALH